eukprot:gene11613-11138_t
MKGPALYFLGGLVAGGVFLSLLGEQLHNLILPGSQTSQDESFADSHLAAQYERPRDRADDFRQTQTAGNYPPQPPPSPPPPPPPAVYKDTLDEVMASVAGPDKMVVATSTDYGYLEITINWMCHMRKLGLDKKVLIFSLDEKIHEAVQQAGFVSYFEPDMAKAQEAIGNWNSKSYNQVVHTKTKHQHAVLSRGYNLFFTDIDIPWMADYRETLMRDTPDETSFVGQQNWPQCDMNVGFFFARSTPDMITFFANVIELEMAIERKEIPIGMDPRKDIFDPSDDQSVIAFHMLCGSPNGTYPGRGNNDPPQGGTKPVGSEFEVQPKWQRRMLFRQHALTNRKVAVIDHTRVFEADCRATTGVHFNYGFLPPKWYQTGHKDWARYKMDESLKTNNSALYHPNFMKGKQKKIDALKAYGRWIDQC